MLEERERLGSTGFGRGVAIPHARMRGAWRGRGAAQAAHPVDFAAADGLPVDLVFGLLSPENSGATHLHALAAISRLMRDAARCAKPRRPIAEALYGLLTNATDRARRLTWSGAEAHYRALEALYRLGSGQPAVRIAARDRRERPRANPLHGRRAAFHAAGAAHGTIYFKMLDDAAFYAATRWSPTASC